MIKSKVKVLYFVDNMLMGGIQTFVIENMKHMDKQKIQIDYLILDNGIDNELKDVLEKMGANIYVLEGIKIKKTMDFFKYFKKVNDFFKIHHDYKVVHLHSSSKNFYILKCAKKYKIPVRIAHSHSIGFQSKSKLKIIVGNIFKFLLKKYATDYFACSELAGKWLFGKKEMKKNNVKIIRNAVDLEKFKCNDSIRDTIRNKLKFENKIVVGHVGRFTRVKNHKFLLDIFFEMHKRNNNTVLILVGGGESEKEIRNKVKELKMEKEVFFVGTKSNVNQYMWAMDIFIFPSLFEGLGLGLIEAQATGLPCFTSEDVVPKEANVSNHVIYISLKKTAKEWENIILNSNLQRFDESKIIKEKGYDILDTAKRLEEFYINS